MDSLDASLPVHPIAIRKAFGEDQEHRAVPGTVSAVAGNRVLVARIDGVFVELALDGRGFFEALRRDDLCLERERPLVLINLHYGLIGLAIGPSKPPGRLAVSYGVCRLENGSAVEIVGAAPQPGWLVFRCTARGRDVKRT